MIVNFTGLKNQLLSSWIRHNFKESCFIIDLTIIGYLPMTILKYSYRRLFFENVQPQELSEKKRNRADGSSSVLCHV
jgi:hypothetical protein